MKTSSDVAPGPQQGTAPPVARPAGQPPIYSPSQAVVLGGGIAGLLAARVLRDHFDRVTLVERDDLPPGDVPRRGVPQGRHAHGLLAGGAQVLERLFPGLRDELVADGAITGDITRTGRVYGLGGYQVRYDSGLEALFLTRPMLEGHLRRRLMTLPGIVPLLGHTARSPIAIDGDGTSGKRVGGVVVGRGGHEGAPREVRADLVVDATGRGSHAPLWMEALGYERPAEETIAIGVGYTTRRYRRRATDLDGDSLAISQAQPPHGLRAGFAFPIEGDEWIVTLTGWLNDHAPTDEAGFRDYARSLAAPDIAHLIERAEPLDDGAVYKYPSSVRRRYEQLKRVPDGYLTIGDALCSFNPVYGQGMTAAAMEADTLDAALRAAGGRRRGFPAAYYRRVARVVDNPWSLSAGADFAFSGTTGPKAPGTDAVNWYVGHVRRAMAADAPVTQVFGEVANLLRPPAALFAPSILLRVLRAGLARRLAVRRDRAPVAVSAAGAGAGTRSMA
jgi:2-polyprenyl-6-methoxyphenol hydroxylase-like FAD-dependent oxidoreductase